MIAALGAFMGFTSCMNSADEHPILNPVKEGAVENFLNTPEMANMALQITESNKGGYVHMTCSQPKAYGFAAPIEYKVQVSLNEDFTTPKAEGCDPAILLETSFYDCAAINPSNKEIAEAMCKMLGVDSKDKVPTPYYTLYMRLIASVHKTDGKSVPNSTVISNVVSISEVSVGYLAIIVPGQGTGLYLRGGMNDWGAVKEWEFLTTDKSGVYELLDVTIDEGIEFKVADQGWGPINLGKGDADLEIGKAYELNGGNNPGNLMMPKKFNGRVQLTQKGSTYTILFEAAEPDVPGQGTGVYIRGGMNDWGTDAAYEFLTTEVKNNWVLANLTIAAGVEFKVADANWDKINLGLGESPIVIGEAYQLVPGGGNIALEVDFQGSAEFFLKGGAYFIKLKPLN